MYRKGSDGYCKSPENKYSQYPTERRYPPEKRYSYEDRNLSERKYTESRYPDRYAENRYQAENRHSAEHQRYSSDHRYRSAPFLSTKRGSDHSLEQSSSEHQQRYLERDKDVFIRSRTFQNSNWRVPQTSPPSGWEKANYDHTQPIFRRDVAAVNSFMPHFCNKKESNYTPTLKAVDNLTPKFLNIDLNHDSVKQQNEPKDGPGRSGQIGVSNLKPSQSSANKSWREPSGPREDNSPGLTIRRKFHLGLKLSVADKEDLMMPKSLMDMLGSKRSLYEAMNELNSKTLKVQMDDYAKEEECCEHLKQEMLSRYPNCVVIPYGTRLLGMAHPEAAIYLFFDTGNNYYQASEDHKDLQTQIRQTVCETMKNCGHCSEVNDWDRQELVTFRHNDTQMNCVVSFLNGFKDQNTLLLKSFLKIDKRLRLLTLLVTDMVFKYHDISKHFTSYVLNIMVIMYLQRIPEPVLPTLQELRESFSYESLYIGEFDCGFPNEFSSPTSSNDLSVENLLKGFCAFYRDFDYEDDVISILGPKLRRSMFLPPYDMSSCEPLGSYFNALRSKENTPKMNTDLPVIVQDPFELSCNAAEKVNLTVLEVFQMMCSDAYEILSKWC